MLALQAMKTRDIIGTTLLALGLGWPALVGAVVMIREMLDALL